MDKKTIVLKPVTIFILVGMVVMFVVGGVIFGANYNKWFNNNENNSQISTANSLGTSLELDVNAGDYSQPENSQQQTSTGIAIPGWGQISIPAGKTEVMVEFPNPVANTDKYYLTFKLVLKDTGEVLYTSGLVPPGKVIQKITLSRALTVGTYDAIVKVQPYKMDENKTPTNNADMQTKLIVK